MEQMEIARETGVTGSTTILRLKGPLTLTTLFLLQDQLRALPDTDMVIDVSEVPYIDSAGLGTILSRWTHTQRAGHKFAMTGVSPRIEVLLEITKVNTVLPMFKTAEDADRSFTGQAACA
ncbi:MAG TPA: STAS domain-containing protein [Bryobacteraceae bacterium]|jgi:anti-sigma B factor antagonist